MEKKTRYIGIIIGLILVIIGGYFIGTVFHAVATTLKSELGPLEAGVILLLIGLIVLVGFVSRHFRR
ncbi:MAG: hypothetical protein AAE983_01465 [Thermoplasmataceae archaeon]|jgi:membrane protein DedA with SNARE-associated domain